MRSNSKIVNLVLLISIVLFSTTSCSVFRKNKTSTPEDFDTFYSKFHQDASFQMSRLQFPIKGKMVNGDEEKNWTKENWAVLKIKIYDVSRKKYKVDFKKSPTSFYQKFSLPDSGFSAEYRFELIKNKWMLVYALDVNI